jgi:uncharacterized membrane protein
MKRLWLLWLRLTHGLWFVPAVVTGACMALALALIQLDTWITQDLEQAWPRLFGAGASAARSMLSAVATSMITVAGVVFSITIVALSLASSQYSPRVLRNFMGDRPTQAVLGLFVGVFAYCLVVLRSIRSPDEGPGFMPSLAVVGGVALSLLAVAVLIYFIHHVAASIQAASILQHIAHDTRGAIDRLFPQELGHPATPAAVVAGLDDLAPPWHPVHAHRSGYLVSVDEERLLGFARQHRCVVRMACPVGDFVVEGGVLVEVHGQGPVSAAQGDALRAAFSVGAQRDVHQDVGFGLQQLVDVALRALSPGINDHTTAIMCIDRLGALLARLARRGMPDPRRSDGEVLRVIAARADFDSLLSLALDAVTEHSHGDTQVLARLLWALDTIERCTDDAGRRTALLLRLSLVQETIGRSVQSPIQRQQLALRADARAMRLRAPQATPG